MKVKYFYTKAAETVLNKYQLNEPFGAAYNPPTVCFEFINGLVAILGSKASMGWTFQSIAAGKINFFNRDTALCNPFA